MLAIIPARTGSKGLPNKNLRPLAGIPLIAHTINAALESKNFKDVYVTTDGNDIADIANAYGAKIINRPELLASDSTEMIDVIKHSYEWLHNCLPKTDKLFCLLQPTSPLRTPAHIKECISLFLSSSCQSAVSICENEWSPYKSFRLNKDGLTPLFSEKLLNSNRQNLEKTYRQNGAIYIGYWEDIFINSKIINTPTMPYIMSTSDSIDVDTLDDLERAEKLLLAQK